MSPCLESSMSSLVYSKLEKSPQEARCISEGNYSLLPQEFYFVGSTNANLFSCMWIFDLLILELSLTYKLIALIVYLSKKRTKKSLFIYISLHIKKCSFVCISPPLKPLDFVVIFSIISFIFESS